MPFESFGEIACAVKARFHCGFGYRSTAEEQFLCLIDSEKREIIPKAFSEAAFEKAAKIVPHGDMTRR